MEKDSSLPKIAEFKQRAEKILRSKDPAFAAMLLDEYSQFLQPQYTADPETLKLLYELSNQMLDVAGILPNDPSFNNVIMLFRGTLHRFIERIATKRTINSSAIDIGYEIFPDRISGAIIKKYVHELYLLTAGNQHLARIGAIKKDLAEFIHAGKLLVRRNPSDTKDIQESERFDIEQMQKSFLAVLDGLSLDDVLRNRQSDAGEFSIPMAVFGYDGRQFIESTEKLYIQLEAALHFIALCEFLEIVPPVEARTIKSRQELEQKLAEGQMSFIGYVFKNLDLSKINFGNKDRRCFDFRFSTFENVDLTGSNFDSANCGSAIFRTVNFTNANLEWVFMPQAQLEDVNFTGAKLNSGAFGGARLKNISFKDANLSDTHFNDTHISGTICLDGSNIDGIRLNGSDIFEATFTPDDMQAKLDDLLQK